MLRSKITRQLLRVNKDVVLRFHVPLTEEKNGQVIEDKIVTTFQFSGKEYVDFNIDSYLTIEIKDGRPYDKNSILYLSSSNIFLLIDGIRKMIDNVVKAEFYIEDGELRISNESAKKHSILLSNVGGRKVGMKPMPIYSESEDLYYEGILMFINDYYNNRIYLTLQQMYALLYNLNKVDFHMYSTSMLNLYYGQVVSGNIDKQVYVPEAKKKHFMKEEVKEKQIIKDNIIKDKSPEEFFGI